MIKYVILVRKTNGALEALGCLYSDLEEARPQAAYWARHIHGVLSVEIAAVEIPDRGEPIAADGSNPESGLLRLQSEAGA